MTAKQITRMIDYQRRFFISLVEKNSTDKHTIDSMIFGINLTANNISNYVDMFDGLSDFIIENRLQEWENEQL